VAVTQLSLLERLKREAAASPTKAVVLAILAVILVTALLLQFVKAPTGVSAQPSNLLQLKPQQVGTGGGLSVDTKTGVDTVVLQKTTLLPKLPQLSDKLMRDLFTSSWIEDLNRASVKLDQVQLDQEQPSKEGYDQLILEATMLRTDSDRAVVVINGQNRHVGDRVGNFVVQEIGSRYAILHDGDNIVKITMP